MCNFTNIMKSFSVIGLIFFIKFYEIGCTVLQCPTLLEIPINTLGGREINLADFVSNGNVSFSPSQMVTLNFSNLNEPLQVKISVKYENGINDACTFLIYTKAEVCFKESIPLVRNAIQNCYNVGDNISCSYTCKSGFVFYDGNVIKTYNCSEMNIWVPSAFPEECLHYLPQGNRWKVEVLYNVTRGLAYSCFASVFPYSFSERINKLCNISYPDKFEFEGGSAGPISSDKVKTIIEGKFLGSLSYRSKEMCMSHFLNDTSLVPRVTLVNCSDNSQAYYIVDDISISKLKDRCRDSYTPRYNFPGIGDTCVPCKPGTYYSHNESCVACSDGFYSESSYSLKCTPCGYNRMSREDKTTCILCPPGFVYQDGGANCIPCRRNTYWVDAKHCEHCPKGYGTEGNGAYHIVFCRANPMFPSCTPGSFSLTGVEPCQDCPLHHYQNLQGQTSCNECSDNERTYQTGRISSSECIFIDNPNCDTALIGCKNGSAEIRNHTAICVCFEAEKPECNTTLFGGKNESAEIQNKTANCVCFEEKPECDTTLIGGKNGSAEIQNNTANCVCYEDQTCSRTNAPQIQEDQFFILIAVLAISVLLNVCFILGICRQRTSKENQHKKSKDNSSYTPDDVYENVQTIEPHYQELGQVNWQHTYNGVE